MTIVNPKVSVVIVNYKTPELVVDAIRSVYLNTEGLAFEIIVVDNFSQDHSVSFISKECPEIILIPSSSNSGFGVGNNIGVAQAKGDYIFLLNSDAYLIANTIKFLVDYMDENSDVACVSPRVNLPTGDRQGKVYGNIPTPKTIFNQVFGLNRLSPRCDLFSGVDESSVSKYEKVVGWVSGVCMMMRRNEYELVGGFDHDIFMYCEDVDLCQRLFENCGKVVHIDDFPVVHIGGASSPSLDNQIRNGRWQQNNMLFLVKKKSLLNYYFSILILFVGLTFRSLILIPASWLNSDHAVGRDVTLGKLLGLFARDED